MITDFELYQDKNLETYIVSQVNALREKEKKSEILNHALFKADFTDMSSVFVVELYPSSEIPYLVTLDACNAAVEEIERYTLLRFEHYQGMLVPVSR